MLKKMPLGGFVPPSEMLAYFFGEKTKFDKRILVAFSGGADSSLMLRLLHDWCKENNYSLFAAHVNHGIRGEEAIRDRDFCVQICEKMAVKLFVLDADVPAISKETGKSIECAARDVRYDFFAEIMEKNDIPILATAHNADDNLETVLFRLARGTGLRGLCGIPPVRAFGVDRCVIRPILKLTKEQVYDICAENGIEYVYDSTNSEQIYARNSIRASVLPVLRAINPDVGGSSVRTCESLREDLCYLDSVADEYLKREDRLKTDELAMLGKPIFCRVMSRLYGTENDSMLEGVHLDALYELVRKGREESSISLPGKKRAVIEGGKLFFRNENERTEKTDVCPDEMTLSEGKNIFGDYVLLLEKVRSTQSSHSTPEVQKQKENIYKLFTQVYLESDKIKGKLCVRCRKNGDKIRFGGMSKDVRKLFSEKKLELRKRSSYPVVCDNEGIVFIPEIAVRDGAKIAKNDKNGVLGIKLTVLSESD